MRNKILKLAFRFSAFAFVVGMTGCDALDLAPIDTYGSGNFWCRMRRFRPSTARMRSVF